VIEQLRAGETAALSVAWLPGEAGEVTESRRTLADAAAGSASAAVAVAASRNIRTCMRTPLD